MSEQKMNERIMIALDVDRLERAEAAIAALPAARVFKVGLEAFLALGEPLIERVHERGKRLFLDLKFKDIPNTVAGAVRGALRYRPDFLTLHLSGGREMVRRAVAEAAARPELTLLGETVLTSLSAQDLAETGVPLSPREAVLRLVELGRAAGLSAFVCSPEEIEPIRARFGREVTLVTPGIRPAGSGAQDQKRVMTPGKAVTAGADYLVIGRAISGASDPAGAFAAIAAEMAAADPGPAFR